MSVFCLLPWHLVLRSTTIISICGIFWAEVYLLHRKWLFVECNQRYGESEPANEGMRRDRETDFISDADRLQLQF